MARLLDPFEQLEREWEAAPRELAAIRPPSAFCSLTDIQEEERVREVGEVEVVRSQRSDKRGGSDGVREGSEPVREGSEGLTEGSEGVSELNDSGVHSDLVEEEETPQPKSRCASLPLHMLHH